ncbi:M14 family zinc carboxypeptidase [Neobacillus niacini]|uniref:M14 family zinc carboxypeptidase n=1 Tax=Neobacillus niacini TaxID=86668 RepID=UPI003B019975
MVQHISLVQKIKRMLKNDLKNPHMLIETIGKSVLGEDIECIVISEDPMKYGISYCEKQYKEITSKHPPSTSTNKDMKLPILINASIHGTEPVGAKVVLELVNYLMENESGDAKELLKHFIFICVPMANPDGLKKGTRYNENGFDLNRDFIFQTQPETKAIVNLIKTCNPVVLFDLHGYVSKFKDKIGLIEPCTQPHNPHYEYDLYIKWALPMAEKMENNLLFSRNNFFSNRYKNMKGVCIPFRDLSSGWDDYAPFCTSSYAILHGAIGCTIEAPSSGNDSIPWMLEAILGACQFLMDNKQEFLSDYLLFFQRGIHLNHPIHPNNFFPTCYIFTETNNTSYKVYRLVNHLINNGVKVDITLEDTTVEERFVPKGSFVARMGQAKSVLANTLLWEGEKEPKGKFSDICVWSLPLLWGVHSITTSTPLLAETKEISNKDLPAQENKTSHDKRIGIIYDGGLYRKQSHAGLKSCLNKLGFTVKEVHPRSLINKQSLEDIDVLIYNGFEHLFYTKERVKPIYQKHVLESKQQQKRCVKTLDYFLSKGGKFIAIGAGPAKITKSIFHLTNCTINTGKRNNNAIIHVDYLDHPINMGYSSKDIGFVYRPVWFSNTDGVEVIARISSDQDALIAGNWSDFENAKGYPVIIKEKSRDVVLIGLEICHRGQPEHLFNILLNAIYS